jgi:hypothetical protein
LASDPNAIKHTGKTLLTTELASLYNIKDVDGSNFYDKRNLFYLFRRSTTLF